MSSSKNEKCPHMFHESCIVDWLLIPHNDCPVCRNDFLVSPRTMETDEERPFSY